MSSDSKVKIYRQSLKSIENHDKLLEYQKKNRDHQKNYALKNPERVKARQAAAYQKRKAQKALLTPVYEGYGNNKSSKLKAASKVSGLPKDDVKAIEVLDHHKRQRLKRVCLDFDFNDDSPPISKKICKATVEKKKLIREFYDDDIISRQKPGKNDAVVIHDVSQSLSLPDQMIRSVTHPQPIPINYYFTFQENGNEIETTKRVMNMSIKEAHKKFEICHPNSGVKLTTFKNYRPENLLSFTTSVKNSCCCIKCENTGFKFEEIKKFLDCDANDLSKLHKLTACDVERFECAIEKCENCKNWRQKIRDFLKTDTDMNQDCVYKVWESSPEDKFTKRINRSISLGELFGLFLNEFGEFRLHIFIATAQQKSLREKKSTLTEEELMYIIDYSQHYAPCAQDEVQVAHFGKRLISVLTAVKYMKNQDPASDIILNDDMSQSPAQHWYYMKRLIEIAKRDNPRLKKLYLFHDGAPTQFKNFKHISNVLFAPEDFGVELVEIFFASCHGKTCGDAVGGTVKNLTDRLLTNNKDLMINNAQEMYNLIKDKCKSRVMLVAKEEYDGYQAMLNERWKRINSIRGTRSFHMFERIDEENVRACVTAYGDGEKFFKMVK